MKRANLFFFLFLLAANTMHCGSSESGFRHFISAEKGKLWDGSKEFRFISFNVPNLHYIEDNLPFTETNPWRLPDEFEIRDALRSIKQMGGRVVRIYTLSVKSSADDDTVPRHVLGPGVFNEEAFVALDRVVQIAGSEGVRLIIPFVDNWKWWGGIAEYAAFRGKEKDAFWSDPQVIGDFKRTIDFVLNRVNTLTGVPYKEDKAILAWETGNELTCSPEWTAEIAAYIKSIDRHHLVMDGFHSQRLRPASLTDPNVDIVTTHHYEKDPEEMVRNIAANMEMAAGKKPYVIGEFGFINTVGVLRVLNRIMDGDCSGALLWSLRFHNRDGGFYWHSEPYGGNLFKAYHWPGFPSGAAFDEIGCLELMRQKAFAVQGLPVPALEPPEPPRLLPIPSVAAISWQGSAGASSYRIERSESPEGPWRTIVERIDDASVQYRPLFNDTGVEIGKTYYYRVSAANDAGVSAPSNVEAAPPVRCFTLVDECGDFSFLYDRSKGVYVKNDEARRAKEDSHRFRGRAQDFIVYRTAGPMQSVRLYVFFIDAVRDFDLRVSGDGRQWQPLPPKAQPIGVDEGEYRYIRPVLYTAEQLPPKVTYLKITFPAEAELARTEIEYGN